MGGEIILDRRTGGRTGLSVPGGGVRTGLQEVRHPKSLFTQVERVIRGSQGLDLFDRKEDDESLDWQELLNRSPDLGGELLLVDLGLSTDRGITDQPVLVGVGGRHPPSPVDRILEGVVVADEDNVSDLHVAMLGLPLVERHQGLPDDVEPGLPPGSEGFLHDL